MTESRFKIYLMRDFFKYNVWFTNTFLNTERIDK